MGVEIEAAQKLRPSARTPLAPSKSMTYAIPIATRRNLARPEEFAPTRGVITDSLWEHFSATDVSVNIGNVGAMC